MDAMTRNSMAGGGGYGEVEEALRRIARLPSPAGLEDRVLAGVLEASRRGRVLAWPRTVRPASGWVRAAAAAAIVFVIAGGGWGVYSRVDRPAPPRVIATSPRVAAPGEFSSAGAIRRPQTLNGPVVAPRRAKGGTSAVPKGNRKTQAASGKAAVSVQGK